MTHFVKLDQQGYVIGRSEGVRPGTDWVAAKTPPPPLGAQRVRYVNERFEVSPASWAPDPTYDLARARQYPSLGDQMDMLWHAMDANVMPRIEPFYSQIKAIKDAHPKPGMAP